MSIDREVVGHFHFIEAPGRRMFSIFYFSVISDQDEAISNQQILAKLAICCSTVDAYFQLESQSLTTICSNAPRLSADERFPSDFSCNKPGTVIFSRSGQFIVQFGNLICTSRYTL
eukprot:scaffold2673_cov278-Chaetoceros_neogracile.AAC.5